MVQVLRGVFVGSLLDIEQQLMLVMLVTAEELVLLWDLVLNINSQDNSRLVGPAPRDVLDSVPATSQYDSRDTEFEHVVNAGSVSLDGEVEMAQSVLGDGVCTTLHDAGIGTI